MTCASGPRLLGSRQLATLRSTHPYHVAVPSLTIVYLYLPPFSRSGDFGVELVFDKTRKDFVGLQQLA